jgi:glycosyltransferase involved in cell wall biosynthesis
VTPTSLAHVPTPLSGDASSLGTVIRGLAGEHAKQGGASYVLAAHNRPWDIPEAVVVPVDYTTVCPREYFTRAENAVDNLAGLLQRKRPFGGRLFVPAIRAASEIRPDAVILHEGHRGLGGLAYFVQRLPDVPVIAYLHIPVGRSYRRREARRLLQDAAGVAFVSEFGRQRAIERLGELPVPSAVVHNGHDATTFHDLGRTESERLRVSYVGQVARHKGVDLMLRALEPLRADVITTVVGSAQHGHHLQGLSDYERELRSLATSLRLDVEFRPYSSSEEVARTYRASDVVCVPSVWNEPFGMVVVEAMACGAVVVTSSRGGLPEAGGDAAVYVDPHDTASFATTLRELRTPTVRERRQAAGRTHAAAFSWQASYRSFEALLDRVA